MNVCTYTITVHCKHMDILSNSDADEVLATARHAIEWEAARVIRRELYKLGAADEAMTAEVTINPVED